MFIDNIVKQLFLFCTSTVKNIVIDWVKESKTLIRLIKTPISSPLYIVAKYLLATLTRYLKTQPTTISIDKYHFK